MKTEILIEVSQENRKELKHLEDLDLERKIILK
jgi:hypothetical protein